MVQFGSGTRTVVCRAPTMQAGSAANMLINWCSLRPAAGLQRLAGNACGLWTLNRAPSWPISTSENDIPDWYLPMISHLYVAGESGTLRTLTADRGGSWNIRNVWAGASPLRNLQISGDRQLLIIVDATHSAQVLNISTGRVGEVIMQLPAAPNGVAVSPSNARVLFQTPGWIHRAGISSRGLNWLGAIRAPKSIPGSRIAFDRQESDKPDRIQHCFRQRPCG